MIYSVSNIEVCLLKVLKNIENKLFFVVSWAYFQEKIGHFDIHALTLRKIKRKWKKISFEKKKIRFNAFLGKIYSEKKNSKKI